MRKTNQTTQIIEKVFPNLSLGDGSAQGLATYLDLLLQWNQVYNLTSIKQESDLIYKHILDGLVPFGLANEFPTPLQGAGLDLGSGAGVPGLVLCVAQPALEVLSVDGVEKKIAFQTIVAAKLGLRRFTPLHCRFEQLAEDPHRQSAFDFVCARALAPLEPLLSWSRLFLKPGGWLWAWKGQNWPEEWGGAQAPDFTLAAAVPYELGLGYGGVLCLLQYQP